jgi:hypothetical protein
VIAHWKGIIEEIHFGGSIMPLTIIENLDLEKPSFGPSKWPRKLKPAKNSKLPKWPENCFEPFGKGGWPPISTWIRIGPVAYMFALLASMIIHNVFHISLLKKYIHDANHVIDWNVIQVEQGSTFQVHLICILDQKIKQIHNRSIGIVKVQWTWYGPKDATWEHEDVMQEEYPHFFEDFGILVAIM